MKRAFAAPGYRQSVFVALCTLPLLARPASAAGADAGAAAFELSVAGKRPTCLDARGALVLTYAGNNHVVALKSRCKKAVECAVFTDVAPERLGVSIAPGEQTEVVTFRGSPAAVFRATANCREM